MQSRICYNRENSPAHLEVLRCPFLLRPGLYLKQLRDRKDFRSCDVVFLLDSGDQERLHSAIAGGHSSKLAKMLSSSKYNLPLVLDLTRYPAYSVKLAVDWMYNGCVEINPKHLADHLIVTSDLGTVFLHRQLEHSLRNLANHGHLIRALNVASHPSTGVSGSTVADLVKLVSDREEKDDGLDPKELAELTLRSVIALVSSRTQRAGKALLINVALGWLRSNSEYVDDVISSIHVTEMAEPDLQAFRMTLTSAMRNPNIRQNVSVYQKKDTDWLAIRVEAQEVGTPCSGSSMSETRSQKTMGKEKFTHSEIDAFNALPSDTEIFETKKYLTGKRSKSTPAAKSKTDSDRTVSSTVSGCHLTRREAEEIKIAGRPIGKSATSSTKESVTGSTRSISSTVGRHHFTRSEADEIKALPSVVFEKDSKRRRSKEKLSSTSSLPLAGGRRSFTKSEMQELNDVPDIFVDGYDGPAVQDFVKWEKKEVDYSPSEISQINRLPDPFASKPKEKRSYTHSEIEDICQLPDVFGGKQKNALVKDCDECNKMAQPSQLTMENTRTADSISDATLEEARQMQLKTLGKDERSSRERSLIRQLDVSFSNEGESHPKAVNSTYANDVPKTGTSSFYLSWK